MRRVKRFFFGVAAIVLATSLTACGDHDDPPAGSAALKSVTFPTLNTFMNASLEIDQIDLGSVDPADANLFVGVDPADGSASTQVPTGGPLPWVDWNDLALGHRLLDVDGEKGKDPTSFPQSNECVAPSKVLSKMDLRYVAAANNNKYAYFAVLRAGNTGDAGYYWLFTKAPPDVRLGEDPCSSEKERLLYDLQQGDVLLGGHFKPNDTPLLTVYTAIVDRDDVPATAAIDFTDSSLWSEVSDAVAAAAVNTTATDPGTFGIDGVKNLDGEDLGSELFAEAAVDLSVFTGGGSNCGATYYGSVITRPSGAGGTSPDLKDLAGPALFDFGSVTASAVLQGSCDGSLSYSAAAVDGAGQQLQGAQCSWLFSDNVSSNTCSGVRTASPGQYTGTVTVTDLNSQCADSVTTTPATVQQALSISLSPDASGMTCPMSADAVTYTASVSGGDGNEVVSWSGGVTCAQGTTCTVDPTDSLMCVDLSLSATVTDPDGLCASALSETETYGKVTIVTASDN